MDLSMPKNEPFDPEPPQTSAPGELDWPEIRTTCTYEAFQALERRVTALEKHVRIS
jgi:hypothetical protein